MSRVTRPQAEPQAMVENDRVVPTKWSFAEGTETGWHVHGHEYVVVPLADDKLVLEEPGRKVREAPLSHGQPYFRPEGVEHDVVDGTGGAFAFLEIEIKR